MTPFTSRPPAARRLAVPAAAALAVVGAVHLIDGPGSLRETPYIGVLELALAATCITLAILLIVRPLRPLWSATLVLNGVALLAFTASRTIGLPASSDDIGNWMQTLGVINVGAELAVIALCVAAVSSWNDPHPSAAPRPTPLPIHEVS